MNNPFLNIDSRLSVKLTTNNIYLLQTRDDKTVKNYFLNETCYINFPLAKSIKIIPFFEKMKENELNDVCFFSRIL